MRHPALAAQQGRSGAPAEGVADGVAGHAATSTTVTRTATEAPRAGVGGVEAGGEQDRVARQEEPDQEAGLDEHQGADRTRRGRRAEGLEVGEHTPYGALVPTGPRERLVVIGGDAAGMSAAAQARRRRDADDLSIVAFERGRATSYSACGIPYWIGGVVESEAALVARTPEQHRAGGIDVRTRTEVVGIDLDRRVVRWRDLEAGTEGDEPFDSLHYAAGSVPMRPPVPGIDAEGVYGVQVLDDGVALRAELDSGRVRRVVVVGGGYIGLEIAEACQRRGLRRDRGRPVRAAGRAPSTRTSARSSPRRSAASASSWCWATAWSRSA